MLSTSQIGPMVSLNRNDERVEVEADMTFSKGNKNNPLLPYSGHSHSYELSESSFYTSSDRSDDISGFHPPITPQDYSVNALHSVHSHPSYSSGISHISETLSVSEDVFIEDNFGQDNGVTLCPIYQLLNLPTDHPCYTKQLLRASLLKIQKSPVGAILIQDAIQNGWCLGLTGLENKDFHLEIEGRYCLLNSDDMSSKTIFESEYFSNALVFNLICALRDIWQERRYGALEEIYDIESLLMLERIRHADCTTLAVLVAWELRSHECYDLWRHVLGSQDGDMALAFSKMVEKHPSSYFNGSALRASFIQWYNNAERVNICDHDTLEYIDSILAGELSVSSQLFGKNKLEARTVEILSCMPDKTAYLQGMGEEILSNPDYAGMHDPINQNHFFHIIYDQNVHFIEDVPFRNIELAKKIFPDSF